MSGAQPEMREMTGKLRESPAAAVHASPMTGPLGRLWSRPLVRGIVFAAATGLFLSAAGALDSARVPFWTRTAWFLAYALLAALVASALLRWITMLAWTRASRWRRFLVLAALMTPTMAIAVWLGIGMASGHFMLADLADYLPVSAFASFTLTGLVFLVFRPGVMTHAAPADAPPPRFLARLPLSLRHAALWAVQAEDHYLRVHTANGQELILMRLSDAITELDGVEGAQTHRSWWVARAAVTDVRRGDGRADLILPDGTAAPVSRTHLRALRAAGWL